jgi:hypothetical protein
MPRTSTSPQRNFTGGEMSPNLDARADLTRFLTSCAEIENLIVIAQGGLTRRSGFRDVAAAMTDSALVPFVFSATDGFALEFAAGKMRAFRDFGQLQDGAAAFELVTPFADAEIPLLRYAQQADVMFLSTGTRPIQLLKRLSNTNWTIADAVFRNGPFMDENADETITVSTAAAGDLTKGTVFTLTASANLFTAGNVGGLFLIRDVDGSAHGQWQPEMNDIVMGTIVRFGDNTYKLIGQGTDTSGGTEPPVHLLGSEWDGDSASGKAYLWQYLHSGYGIVEVTGYTSPTSVTVKALSFIPDGVQGTGTWRWAEGAWCDRRGYPKLVGFHKGRFYAAASTAEPLKIWGSVTDDYTNMDALRTDDTNAFSYQLSAREGQVNFPMWLCSFRQLGVGTAGDECVLRAADGSVIAPDNVDIDEGTSEGSAFANAVKVEGPVFISRDGKRVHEMGYDVQQSAWIAPDLTIAADHITGPGVTKLVWMRDPYRLLFVRRSDGVLACSTLRKDQEVNGWHRHPVQSGFVEDICAVPSPEGTRMDLWAIITYALAGGTVRRVQSLMPFFQQQKDRAAATVADAFIVDCGFVYQGAPATHIAGLDLLNGETVAILADGKVQPQQVVNAGAITLTNSASHVAVGLPLKAKVRSLKYDKDAAGGKLGGRSVRVNQVIVQVRDATGIMVASGDREPELLTPSEGGTYDAPAQLISGVLRVQPLSSDWDSGGDITLTMNDPLPATILAWSPNAQVGLG